MVLHDITQALSCGQHFIVIRQGELVATGEGGIINADLLKDVFRVKVEEFRYNDVQRAIVPIEIMN